MKIINVRLFLLLISTIMFSSLDLSLCMQHRNSNMARNRMLMTLRAEVDGLIDKLKKEKFPYNYNMTEAEKVDYMNSEKKIQEDILGAFKSLNDDFLNYEKLIKEGEKEEKHSKGDSHNDKDFSQDDVDKLFNFPDDKERINIVDQIKKNIKLIRKVKRHPQMFKGRDNIKHSFHKMWKLFDSYKQFDKDIKDRFQKEIDGLKKQMEVSDITSENIKKALNSFEKMIDYSEKLLSDKERSEEDVEWKKQSLMDYKGYLDRLLKTEKDGNATREVIEKKILNIINSPDKFYSKVSQVLRLQTSLLKIAEVNERMIQIKQKILENLKKNSVRNFSDLKNLISTKKESSEKNMERIQNVKKMFDIATKIKNSRENLKKVKTKIVDGIQKLDDKAKNLTHVEGMRQRLEDHLKKTVEKEANKAEEDEEKEEKEVQDQHDHSERVEKDYKGDVKDIKVNKTEKESSNKTDKHDSDSVGKEDDEQEEGDEEGDQEGDQEANEEGKKEKPEKEEEEKPKINNINKINNKTIEEDKKPSNKAPQDEDDYSHENELSSLHSEIVNSLADAKQHHKDIQKAHNALTEEMEEDSEKEDLDLHKKVSDKVEKSKTVVEYLEHLAEMSQRALKQIQANNKKTDEYNDTLKLIMHKLEVIRKEIDSLSQPRENTDVDMGKVKSHHNHKNKKGKHKTHHSKDHHHHSSDCYCNHEKTEEEIESLRTQIHKLCDLYENIKKESVQNYLRNEVLKKILDMNTSILNKEKLERLKDIIKYHK